MAVESQTYANHVYRPRAWLITYFVAAVVFVVLMAAVVRRRDA